MNSHNENLNDNTIDEADDRTDAPEPKSPAGASGDSQADDTAMPDAVNDIDGTNRGDRTDAEYDDADGNAFDADSAADPFDGDEGPQTYDAQDADLPQLLRRASRLMRRELLAAAADHGFDPRDFGRMRRERRWAEEPDEVADGALWREGPAAFGRSRDRAGTRAAWSRDGAEFRERIQTLRDEASSRVEEVLSSEEFEQLKTSLSKIADSLGHDANRDHRHTDGPCRRDRGGSHWRDQEHGHDHEREHGHDHEREHGHDREHAHRHDRDESRRRGRGTPRGGGRGRGFGPGAPGFGPGSRRFGPFGWFADQGGHGEDIEASFERGFAAGFEQGSRS